MKPVCAVALLLCLPLCAADTGTRSGVPRILSPRDGARPRSSFVFLRGSAAALAPLEIVSGETVVATVTASQDGLWERIVRLGEGPHRVHVRTSGAPASASVPIQVVNAGGGGDSLIPLDLAGVRSADIILSKSETSEQNASYAPDFTHAALFVGADSEGTPLIIEALLNDAGSGEISETPIDRSLFYRRGVEVLFLRPAQPLTEEQRNKAVAWARKMIAATPRYWSVQDDFSAFYVAWMLWDTRLDGPSEPARFEATLKNLDGKLRSDQAFTCVSLVQRAYLEATGSQLDIAAPNRAKFSGWLRNIATETFLDRIRPYLLVPDTLYLSGKLVRVQ